MGFFLVVQCSIVVTRILSYSPFIRPSLLNNKAELEAEGWIGRRAAIAVVDPFQGKNGRKIKRTWKYTFA
jgi:hypothetical protein